MQFTIVAALAMAATAFAAPVEDFAQPQVLISLPAGCTKSDLASEYPTLVTVLMDTRY